VYNDYDVRGVLSTIEYLRKNAELNLCYDCFKKYQAVIEPSIIQYLAQPLDDFRQAESQITQIVMKSRGVFRGDIWVLSMSEGDEEKVEDDIDVKMFRDIVKWSFKRKIDYLHKKGILLDSSYFILDKARDARNKIHSDPIVAELSVEDYALFSMANGIASQIITALRFEKGEEVTSNLLSKTEKVAEQWLATFHSKYK
jgi:hypothetical protein